VLVVALTGAALLLAACVTTVIDIEVGSVVRDSQDGFDRHGAGLILLAVSAVALAWLVSATRAWPPAAGLVAVGLVVILIVLLGDLPDTDQTGVYGQRYEDASAGAGVGLWLELAGGAVIAAAGALALGALRRPRAAVSRAA